MRAGWRVHRRDPYDQGLQWPYLPCRFPLTTNLFFKEIEICPHAWDSEQKSRDRFHHGRSRVFRLPELWQLPMPWRMMIEEEKCFWCGQDLVSSEVLELGVLPEDVQMEEVGEWVTWGPAIEPVP